MSWSDMRLGLFSFVLPQYRPEMEELYTRIRNIWAGYLRGQIVLMVIVGIVFTIVWLIMGIPGALVLGLIAGLFTLVPDVGPFLAVMFAAGVALLEGSSWIPLPNFGVAGLVLLAYLILIGIKNFFVRPIVMGRSVHMNEGLVFIVIIVATILAGILGALLVVPVIASATVILGYLRRKILGLPAFDEDSAQLVTPPEEIKQIKRRFSKTSRSKWNG
jgi:predicted PurR-regulated permease PerM